MNENYENDLSLPPIHHYLSESEKLLLFGHENNGKKLVKNYAKAYKMNFLMQLKFPNMKW
jgi:hypothetical protein